MVDAQLVAADKEGAACAVLHIGAGAAGSQVHLAVTQVLQTSGSDGCAHRYGAVVAVLNIDLVSDVFLHIRGDVYELLVAPVFDADGLGSEEGGRGGGLFKTLLVSFFWFNGGRSLLFLV